MSLYKRIVFKFFLTYLFLITYITHVYLIYGVFAYPDTTLNFEKYRRSKCFKVLLYVYYMSK